MVPFADLFHMKRKTAFDIIKQIHSEVEEPELALEVMVKDIRMMGFKIRPLIGDIASLENLRDEVLKSLWKIGKIDEIVSNALYDLDEDDQDRLMGYLNTMEIEAEKMIKDSLLRQSKKTKKNILRLEVFKNEASEVIVN